MGSYDPNRLANLGIGHGAIDVGGAYTYLNPKTGWEFSSTTGFTFNFENTETDYTNGIDWHLDWGVAKFLSKQLFVGLVGYAYVQLTPDKGQPPILGDFEFRRSRSVHKLDITSMQAAGRSTLTCVAISSSMLKIGSRVARCP